MGAAANSRRMQRVHICRKALRIYATADFPCNCFHGNVVGITTPGLMHLHWYRGMSSFSHEIDGVDQHCRTRLLQHNAPHHEHAQELIVTQVHCGSVFARDQAHISLAFDKFLSSFKTATGSCSVQGRPKTRIQLKATRGIQNSRSEHHVSPPDQLRRPERRQLR